MIPQAVLSPLTRAAIFLVVTIDAGGESTVRELLPELSGLQRAVGFRAQQATLSCVTGIGSQAWDRLFAGSRPAELHPFRELTGPVHRAVATPGDLLFHIRAQRPDLCFALAAEIMDRIRDAVSVRDEVHGFKYFDVRDLLGFVDGTENPVGPVAHDAVMIGAEDPPFAGGSYVIVQKYLHDLRAWNAQPVEAQELAIGRRKLSDIELDDAVKPPDSHVALTTIEDPDGTKHEILRDNMPFGEVGPGEFGTYFIGYARTPTVTELMLERHVPRRPAGTPRPDPGLLHRRHRHPVLRPERGLPRRPARSARHRGDSGRGPGVRPPCARRGGRLQQAASAIPRHR